MSRRLTLVVSNTDPRPCSVCGLPVEQCKDRTEHPHRAIGVVSTAALLLAVAWVGTLLLLLVGGK